MSILTLKRLIDLGVCIEQRKRFAETFGESVDVTPELCVSVANEFNWDWAAVHLLSAPAIAEYDRATAAAWAKYDRTKASAWAKFERTKEAAITEFERTKAASWAKFERTKASAWVEFERTKEAAWAEFERTIASAFGELYSGSANHDPHTSTIE